MGGNYFVLFGIDGDVFCLIDFVKDIENGCGVEGFRIQWLWETTRAYIDSDTLLMNMWDQIESKDGMYHIYLQEELGDPQTHAPQTKNIKSHHHPQS